MIGWSDGVVERFDCGFEYKKFQAPNNKWFDKLTTLSQVEGQYPNSKLQKTSPLE
jgi:hypothetical protein